MVGRSPLRTVPAEWVQYVVQLLEVRVLVAGGWTCMLCLGSGLGWGEVGVVGVERGDGLVNGAVVGIFIDFEPLIHE